MNVEQLSLAVAVMVALAGIAVGGLTAWRYRDMPATREELLRIQIEGLRKQISDADDQIAMLLEDRMKERKHVVDLERRIRELERELTHYKNSVKRPAAAGIKAKPAHIDGVQLRNLRTQLLDAYTTHEQWHALVQDVDHQMDVVAMGDNLNSVVAKILNQANAEGWIRSLIVEAARQRPNLTALQTLARSLLEAFDA